MSPRSLSNDISRTSISNDIDDRNEFALLSWVYFLVPMQRLAFSAGNFPAIDSGPEVRIWLLEGLLDSLPLREKVR